MYQDFDPYLDELRRKPMMMAYEEEYEDEEEEVDLFSEDVLHAYEEEKAQEQADAAAFAQELLAEVVTDEKTGELPPQEAPLEAELPSDMIDEPLTEESVGMGEAPLMPEQVPSLFTRPGIRRSLIGYALMTGFGIIPIGLLILFMLLQKGMSLHMTVFLTIFFAGWLLSIYNLIYHFQHGYEFTVSFNLRSFFRFWPEVIVISGVLIGMSFWNLSHLSNGKHISMTGKKFVVQEHLPEPKEVDNFSEEEEEEVIARFLLAQSPQVAKKPDTSPKNDKKTKNQPNKQQKKRKRVVTPSGGAVSIVGSQQQPIDEIDLTNIRGLLEGSQKTLENSHKQYRQLLQKPGVGGVVGGVGVGPIPESMLPHQVVPESKHSDVEVATGNPTFDRWFLGGALGAAFGYAFILAIAGAIFAIFRKFETPFSQKYVEIIDIRTAEVTVDKQPIAPILKPLNLLVRMAIGFTFGGTLGFILGLFIILPLFMFFKNGLSNPQVAPILNTLGVSNNPDLAFVHAVILGGLLIPLVIGVVAKMSPAGMAVSEELLKAHYETKPTIQPGMTAGQMGGGMASGEIPEPALIQFGHLPEDKLETDQILNELNMSDDTLASEIMEEFGKELEQVFGIDPREFISKKDKKKTSVDKKKLASALDESFGELGNVPVEISAELGQASIPVTDWLNIQEGSLLVLDKPASADIDILFNGVRKGSGKLMVSENAIAVKVSTTFFGGNHQNQHLLT